MKFTYILLLGALLPITLAAQLTPKRVVAFKSGLSFIHEAGKVKTEDGRFVRALPFPNLEYDAEGDVNQRFVITAGSERVGSSTAEVARYWTSTKRKMVSAIERDTAVSIEQLLRANYGRGLTVTVTTKEGATYRGILTYGSAGVIQLLVEGNYVRVSLNEVRSVRFADRPRSVTTSVDTFSYRQKSFNVAFTKEVGKMVDLDLFYLARGFNWIPTYSVVLDGSQRFRLMLEAQIINDQQDYQGVDLQLGIGQPNFLYANQPSTFFTAAEVRQLRDFSNQFQQNQMLSNTFASQTMQPGGGRQNRNATLGDGDIFYYHVPDFELDRGHTANYRLLGITGTYRDIYTCNLNQNADEPLKVYHDIAFKNTGELPLTTGPAFITDGENRAVGQSKMSFTPKGAETRLRIAGTPEVLVNQRAITFRIDSIAPQWEGYYRFETTLKVKVENYKAKAVDLRLKRNVKGELIASSSPQKLMGTTRTQEVNPTLNTYEWSLNIPAGEERELTITYNYWAR